MVRIHGRVIPVVLAVLGVLGVVSVDAIRGEPLPAAEAVDLNDEVLRDRARPGLEVGAVVHGYDPEWRLDPSLDVSAKPNKMFKPNKTFQRRLFFSQLGTSLEKEGRPERIAD